MADFETRVKELSSDILTGGSRVFETETDEQEVFEAYREALREAGIGKLGFLADSAIRASEAKKASSELVFEMFADAVDLSTVTECNQIVWGELESRASQLQKITLSTQQRPKLALLRVANELLRRLSQTQDPILCGRVLMLLATALPLSDSSGFNIGGKYNFENETAIESQQQFVEEGSQPKDYTLYERFWKLQRFFAGPFVLNSLQDLKTCLETTFSAFESKPLLSMDPDSLDKSDFFPKYLTSGRLLSLQWADPRLRRFVLVQVLFFLRQVAAEAETGKNVDLTNQAATWRSRAIKLLNQIPPKGKEFTESILAAIDREVVWESWKKDKCPVIEQQGTASDAVPRVPRSETYEQLQQQHVGQAVEPPKWAISKQQSTKWRDALTPEDEGDEDEDREDDGDGGAMFLTLLSQRMLDALQLPGYDFSVYDPRKDYLYCWQGLRAVRQARFDLFAKLGARGTFEDAVRILNDMPLAAKAEEEPQSKKEEEAMRVENGEGKSEVEGLDGTPLVPSPPADEGAKDEGVNDGERDMGEPQSAQKRQRMEPEATTDVVTEEPEEEQPESARYKRQRMESDRVDDADPASVAMEEPSGLAVEVDTRPSSSADISPSAAAENVETDERSSDGL